jgi:hypothetical protein
MREARVSFLSSRARMGLPASLRFPPVRELVETASGAGVPSADALVCSLELRYTKPQREGLRLEDQDQDDHDQDQREYAATDIHAALLPLDGPESGAARSYVLGRRPRSGYGGGVPPVEGESPDRLGGSLPFCTGSAPCPKGGDLGAWTRT